MRSAFLATNEFKQKEKDHVVSWMTQLAVTRQGQNN